MVPSSRSGKEQVMSTSETTLFAFQLRSEELTEKLNRTGYRTVFDISSESLSGFKANNPDIPASDAREIYKLAVQRTENLIMLSEAWQLHNDPIIKNIPKLDSSVGLKSLNSALERSLGDGSDFNDLFPERSPEGYADIASIQSLFSPGRYLTVLYKIARQLHDTSSEFHIDNRRPDLKSLVLSDNNLNKLVTSLDILLDVLQPDDIDTLNSLKDKYYPMNLPYDDSLTQIRAALEAKGTDLVNIWDILLDTQRNAFTDIFLVGREFNLAMFYSNISSYPFYLDNISEIGGVRYAIIPLSRSSVLTYAKFQLVGLNEKYYLRTADGFSVNGIDMSDCYLTRAEGIDVEIADISSDDGLMLSSNRGVLPSSSHIPFQITAKDNGSFEFFSEDYGYVSAKSLQPGYRLGFVNHSTDHLLKAVYRDGITSTTLTIQDILPSKLAEDSESVNSSRRTRELLCLTPNSMKLLINSEATAREIANHFNIAVSDSDSESYITEALVSTLNIVDNFCHKTGLTFNQLLTLTAQGDYQTKSKEFESKYVKFIGLNKTNPVQVSEYGAAFLNAASTSPLWVAQYDDSGNSTDTPILNFTADNVVELASRAEKLVRLSNVTGLSFEQLDWMITNASRSDSSDVNIDIKSHVLNVLAEYIWLNKQYGITSDVFTAFIGEVNTFAEKGQKSLYEALFSNADNTIAIPSGATLQFAVNKQGEYEAICCKSTGVTPDEFFRIGMYCFGNSTEQITVDEKNIAQIYRMGKIPQILGLSFTEAEQLWKIMAGGDDALLELIGSASYNTYSLHVIYRTEVIISWMNEHQLDVSTLNALVTNTYSTTATHELYNFLLKVYQSASGITSVAVDTTENSAPIEKLCQAMAAGFHLKANIMMKVISWIGKTSEKYTINDFWDNIQEYFNTDHESPLDDLEKQTALLQWCQQISQYVLIVKWCGLNEQDLELVTENPDWLMAKQTSAPTPTLLLLLILSRLKEWQQRTQVSSDEAMRHFTQANSSGITRDTAITLLSNIHNWNEEYTSSINTYLFGEDGYPTNFEQVYTLERWTNLGKQLNIGSRTLSELSEMSGKDEAAESTELISSVANSLMAAQS